MERRKGTKETRGPERGRGLERERVGKGWEEEKRLRP